MTDRRRNIFVLLLVVRPADRGRSSLSRRSRPGWASTSRAGCRCLPGQADEAVDGQQRRHRPHARHHARARRPARRLRAGDPALGPGPDRRLAPGRQERRRGGQPGRHDGAAVLLRLGDERPRRQLQAGAGGRERHRRLRRRARASPRPTTTTAVTRAAQVPRAATSRTARPTGSSTSSTRRRRRSSPARTRRAGTWRRRSQNKGIKPGPNAAGRRGQARARSSSARSRRTTRRSSDQSTTSCRTTRR